jgi:hypothetical protein
MAESLLLPAAVMLLGFIASLFLARLAAPRSGGAGKADD